MSDDIVIEYDNIEPSRWLGERNKIFYKTVCEIADTIDATTIITNSNIASIFEMLVNFRYSGGDRELETINGSTVVNIGSTSGGWHSIDNKPTNLKFTIYCYCDNTEHENT